MVTKNCSACNIKIKKVSDKKGGTIIKDCYDKKKKSQCSVETTKPKHE